MSVPGGPPYAQQPMQMQQPQGGMPPQHAGPTDPARTAAMMLLAAAALMFIGLISKSWLTGAEGTADVTIGIGPLGAEMCKGSQCIGAPTGAMPGNIELFMYLALIAGFAAVAGAGVIGGMTISGKRHIPLPPNIALGLFGVASAAMVIFIVRVFAEGGDLRPGWAMFPGIGGAVLASFAMKKLMPFVTGSMPAAAAGYVGQQSQPMQPYGGQQSQPMQPYGGQPQQMQQMQQMQQPQPPQQGVPSCPRCGTPLQFVQQYQRWFCSREQQYI